MAQKISSFDSNKLSGALLCLCSLSHFLSAFRSFCLFSSFFYRNRPIWQTNLVWSSRTSFVSLTCNKSKFLHCELHLLWASTVYGCFFLATSRTAKFRVDNNSHLQLRMSKACPILQ